MPTVQTAAKDKKTEKPFHCGREMKYTGARIIPVSSISTEITSNFRCMICQHEEKLTVMSIYTTEDFIEGLRNSGRMIRGERTQDGRKISES